jgi:hypothetical protein
VVSPMCYAGLRVHERGKSGNRIHGSVLKIFSDETRGVLTIIAHRKGSDSTG